MSERRVNLNYLNDEEIIKLYELFFGSILIKREASIYLTTLQSTINKDGFIQKALEKLNKHEIEIINSISSITMMPYNFIFEKLSIILGEQASIVGKYLTNLINRNYIFLRSDKTIVIPDIYNTEKLDLINITPLERDDAGLYDHRHLNDFNNFINYLLTKDIVFSKSGVLYKKDYDSAAEVFTSYSKLDRDLFDIFAYYYSAKFVCEDTIDFIEVSAFYGLTPVEKALSLLKVIAPYFYHIVKFCYNEKKSFSINKEVLKRLWINALLLTEIDDVPYHLDYKMFIRLMTVIGLFTENSDDIIVNYYSESTTKEMTLTISSNYTIFVNSDATSDNLYKPSLFSDYIKYDKFAEYEISPHSVKRAVYNGYSFKDFKDFISQFDITLAPNVDTTISQWFDKFGSHFYVTGTIFFCETQEKGKIISKLIDNNMVEAYEIKKDSVFLIPEGKSKIFFDFLEKSGITFYENRPKKIKKSVSNIKFPDYNKLISVKTSNS